jgi:hypothetical protein
VKIVNENLAVSAAPDSPLSDQSRLTLVGGSAGAAFVFLSNNYVHDQYIKNTIVYISPLLGIIMMSIWKFCNTWVSEKLKRHDEENTRRDILCRMTEVRAFSKELLASLEAYPLATPGDKAKARADVQSIERAIIKLHVSGFVILD